MYLKHLVKTQGFLNVVTKNFSGKFTHSGLLVVNQAVLSVINKWLVVLLPIGGGPDSCFVASSH